MASAEVGRGGQGWWWQFFTQWSHDVTHAGCGTLPTLLAAIAAATLISHMPILPCLCLMHVRLFIDMLKAHYH